MVVPQNGRFIMEYPIETDDLGVPPILGNLHIHIYIYCGAMCNCLI